MMMQLNQDGFPAPLHIINARVPGLSALQVLTIREGIVRVLPMDAYSEETGFSVLDVAGDWISLGGVDLQINGALGLAFPDLKAEDVSFLGKICEFLYGQGVDGFLPTLVTTSVENIQRSLLVISEYMQQQHLTPKRAKILGVHLEGPFLNYQKRGAHPAEYLLPLTLDQVKRVLGDSADVVIVTLSPELDRDGDVIPYLRQRNIIVSLGHSQATAVQAQSAFQLGASMVTHAFNAMPSLHHREPGLLAAAITNPQVMCGFIADGQHVVPMMIDLLLRASDKEKGLFLVSDALAPLGLPDGVYPWDSRQINVTNGTARLLDGTLSGTTLPLLVGVQNLVKWGVCDVDTAIALATTSPRHAIGLPTILSQSDSLLRWHWDQVTHDLTWQRLGS
jgi:N-acetylglucosamine-6-phosphate deacetylase